MSGDIYPWSFSKVSHSECQLNTKLQKSHPNAMSQNQSHNLPIKHNYIVSTILQINIQSGTTTASTV